MSNSGKITIITDSCKLFTIYNTITMSIIVHTSFEMNRCLLLPTYLAPNLSVVGRKPEHNQKALIQPSSESTFNT